MRRILFLYNNYEREHTIVERFSEELQNHKNVKVYQKNSCDKDLFFQLLKIRPHIVVTCPLTTKGQIDTNTFAKVCCHSIIITYTTEGLIDYHDKENIRYFAGIYDYDPALVDYHLFWGRAVAKYLGQELYRQNKIISKTQIRIIGNPMYEKGNYSDCKIDDIARDARSKVLILTGFDASLYTKRQIINVQDIVDITGKRKKDSQKMYKEYLNMMELERKYCDKYISHVVSTANKYKEILFIVKLHPHEIASINRRHMKLEYLEPLYSLENVKLIKTSIPISQLLQMSSLMVHYGSTVDLESYLYKVPTLKLEQIGVINKHMIERCRRLTSSTYYENIEDENVLDKYMEKIKHGEELFRQSKELEGQLYEYMDYAVGKPYHPSKKMAGFLCGNLKYHKIKLDFNQRLQFMVKIVNTCLKDGFNV